MYNNYSCLASEELKKRIKNGIDDWRVPIYRLSAYYKDYHGRSFHDMEPYELKTVVGYLADDLHKVAHPPNDIFIYYDCVEAQWFPEFPIIPDSINDASNLISNFLRFVNSFGFATGSFNYGNFADDPLDLTVRENFMLSVLGITTKSHLVENNSETFSHLLGTSDDIIPTVHFCSDFQLFR